MEPFWVIHYLPQELLLSGYESDYCSIDAFHVNQPREFQRRKIFGTLILFCLGGPNGHKDGLGGLRSTPNTDLRAVVVFWHEQKVTVRIGLAGEPRILDGTNTRFS